MEGRSLLFRGERSFLYRDVWFAPAGDVGFGSPPWGTFRREPPPAWVHFFWFRPKEIDGENAARGFGPWPPGLGAYLGALYGLPISGLYQTARTALRATTPF